MEIHELNTFSGTLGSSDYFATDNGSDTSKVSAEQMLSPLNDRIDNIIAGGDAPSAAEVTDARLGAVILGSTQYTSLGNAVRGQVTDLYNDIIITNKYLSKNIAYTLTAAADGYVSTGNGQVYTTVSGYKNSGFVEINADVTHLVVKDSFHYSVDGICFYDADQHFIKGIGKSSFVDEYLIVQIPTGGAYFNTCWKETDGVGYVADYNGEIIEEIETHTAEMPFGHIVNGLDLVSDNTFNAWNSATVTRTANGSAQLTIPTSGDKGVYGQMFAHVGGKKINVFVNYTATNPSTTLKAYLYGTPKPGASYSVYNLSIDVPQGTNAFTVDGDYLDVYSSIDLSKPISILLVNKTHTADTATITDFRIGYYEIETGEIVGNDLKATLNNITDQITDLKSTKGSADFIVAPNGTRYALQLNTSGAIILVPVIPNGTVFFGNSILLGFNDNYGITTGNYFGMAASKYADDYYSKFGAYVTSLNPSYSATRFRYNTWEDATTEAAQQTVVADMITHVDASTQLVVVQLGDNINTDAKKAIFESGAMYMLQQIRTAAPNARVVWMGSWFNPMLINQVMPSVCKRTGCVFVPISDLNTIDNQSAIGNTYEDTNSNTFTISSSGVAAHPGDAGMLAIANRLAYTLAISDNESAIE